MKYYCTPNKKDLKHAAADEQSVILYERTNKKRIGSVGAAVKEELLTRKLSPINRAWDLLSIALSVIAADHGSTRIQSSDGWARQLDLKIAVAEPEFWSSQKDLIERQLRFLTTDMWNLGFMEGGFVPSEEQKSERSEEDSVLLLSGGLDSLIGALDIASNKSRPYAVSQVVLGDAPKQSAFASQIGKGLSHIQLNHNVRMPLEEPALSDRARSIIFLAYGVIVATALKAYNEGKNIPLYVCENGFISINPPLTGTRLGSLSTRTANPYFLKMFQELLVAAKLHINILTPYQFSTKGEMLRSCSNQEYLKKNAHIATSCGRYRRMGFQHCGRCVPCLIRRAAFQKWGFKDQTEYKFAKLSKNDKDHALFDDVRSAAMAVAEVRSVGLDQWIGASLNSALLGDVSSYKNVVQRGIEELGEFLDAMGVR
jgi:7-cyano-7-deazaguanine synthase in queuosine biosynthesis